MVNFATDSWIRTNWTEECTIEFDSDKLKLRLNNAVDFEEDSVEFDSTKTMVRFQNTALLAQKLIRKNEQ